MNENEAGFSLAKWAEAAGLPIKFEDAQKMTWIEALKHSIKKWKALRDIPPYVKSGRTLDDGDVLVIIDASSCALCQKTLDNSTPRSVIRCRLCPLRLYTAQCGGSAYTSYLESGDPEKMIRALEECLEDLEAGRLEANERGVFEYKEPRA